jgi:UDP-N-acetylmuramate dehydrogenase
MALNIYSQKWLEKKFEQRVKFDEPMSKHTSLKVGGPADAFIISETRQELSEVISWAEQNSLRWMVIGGGTNLLVKDTGIQGIVVILSGQLATVEIENEDENNYLIKAAAGAKMQSVCRFAIEKGAEGLNFAIGIPGTAGGAVVMNAGTSMGSIENILETVTFLLPNKGVVVLVKDELHFKYRSLALKKNIHTPGKKLPVILEALFRLKKGNRDTIKREAEKIFDSRMKNQPIWLPSAGCFFKNPPTGEPAGKLIELAGLKGAKTGGAKISEKHANYLVNTGNASAEDFLSLMEKIQDTVLKRFNVKLEPEVKIAG